MNSKLIECFANPVKCKMLIEIKSKGKITAKQLSETHNDIPKATLYRYLNKMLNNGIIKVVEENQIRGTIEKVYSMEDTPIDGSEVMDKIHGEEYMGMFTQYIMGFMKEFQEYTARDDIDIINDGSGFSTAPIYATTDELRDAYNKIGKILEPLMKNEATPERALRSIGIIATPPNKMN